MGNATRASRGKPHIFLTVENRVGPASRFRDSQSTAQPLRLHFGLGFYSFGLFCNLIRLNSLIIGFLFVVPLPCYVASSIPNITVRDLPFTTLGCRYPRPDSHRLDVRHARRTKKEALDLQGLPGGGLYWTRTSDPIDVNDVLYQLSQQTVFHREQMI